jgi:hypothetical protein
MENRLKIEIVGDEIIIKLHKDDLAALAEYKPDSSYKILDRDKYLQDFKFQVENYSHSNAVELGMSELQYLFDQMIDATYEDGSEAIMNTEEDHED